MSKQEKPRCAGRVFDELQERQCSRSASAKFQGKHYCGTHLRIAKQIHAGGVLLLEHAEQKRRADCFDELLGTLRHIENAAMDISCERIAIRDAARAAIAKATGGAQ